MDLLEELASLVQNAKHGPNLRKGKRTRKREMAGKGPKEGKRSDTKKVPAFAPTVCCASLALFGGALLRPPALIAAPLR